MAACAPSVSSHPMRETIGHATESAFGACRLMSYVFTHPRSTARPLRFAGTRREGCRWYVAMVCNVYVTCM